jgi:hypothetical protein
MVPNLKPELTATLVQSTAGLPDTKPSKSWVDLGRPWNGIFMYVYFMTI